MHLLRVDEISVSRIDSLLLLQLLRGIIQPSDILGIAK